MPPLPGTHGCFRRSWHCGHHQKVPLEWGHLMACFTGPENNEEKEWLPSPRLKHSQSQVTRHPALKFSLNYNRYKIVKQRNNVYRAALIWSAIPIAYAFISVIASTWKKRKLRLRDVKKIDCPRLSRSW